ncbi:efflux RND transporter periplasmic adaptor subunit [Beijerinckia sp. L45]|uniref:efflux RND transporter periplasmic adaptor subunit n=1 Tax=Beijerinckia sp. L45 TaxID=1641855 RepID=UPI00131E7818|nr:efflux RND transporter periplasmic adaptor subunit [Beijerinckia sp. L45]
MSPIEGQKRSRKVWIRLLLAAMVLGGVAAYGIVDRDHSEAKLAQWTHQQAVPSVDLVTPRHPTDVQHLTLPADVEAFYTAPIHARVSGYVKMWYYDIGAKVQAGDVLARIDTPDLDQQTEQARGELAKAQADLNLAQLTAARWKELRVSQAVSQQTADEKTGDALAKKAQVDAAQANVDRLKALQSFKDIAAPFDGVVTARRIDVGALVSSSNASQPGLFDVASVEKMRVYVRVPQVYTASLKKGMVVTLTMPQYPGRTFKAVLTTTADAISQESRALLVELDLDNKDKLLSPGAYAQARFDLPLDAKKLVVPSGAVIFRNAAPEVAVVGDDDKVTMKPIEITLDTGTTVEIAGGLSLADRIVTSPSDSLASGDVVQVATVDGKNASKSIGDQASRGAAE